MHKKRVDPTTPIWNKNHDAPKLMNEAWSDFICARTHQTHATMSSLELRSTRYGMTNNVAD